MLTPLGLRHYLVRLTMNFALGPSSLKNLPMLSASLVFGGEDRSVLI